MKRPLEIAKHVNMFDEAIYLLYHWINKGDMKEVKIKYTEEMELDIDSYNKRFETMTAIYQEITQKLHDKKERIEYYFKERYSQFGTYGALAVYWNIHNYDNILRTYEECSNGMTEAMRVKAFADVISDEESSNTPSSELQNISDLIRFLEGTSYEKDAKWEAIHIYNNQKCHYDEVYDILSRVIELIKTHSMEIEQLELDFYNYWSEFQKDNNIIDVIYDKLNISWKSDRVTAVVPILFMPYGITISINEPDVDAKDIIRLNFMINKNFIITDHKISKDDVINVTSVFSDKSKMDIMEFISSKPCYGKEIANELNLSTATISYHVNSLLKVGFVKADLISNKVYYSLDKNRVTSFLDEMKDYFDRL